MLGFRARALRETPPRSQPLYVTEWVAVEVPSSASASAAMLILGEQFRGGERGAGSVAGPASIAEGVLVHNYTCRAAQQLLSCSGLVVTDVALAQTQAVALGAPSPVMWLLTTGVNAHS